VRVADGNLAEAIAATDQAAACFAPIPEAEGERAAVQITRLWIGVEREGHLPSLAELLPLRDELTATALWPEPFLALAAMIMNAARVEDEANVLRHLEEMESTIRIRGMTQVLPAMQLLREDHRRRVSGNQTTPKGHLGLSDEQLIMLLPDVPMLLTNWGAEVNKVPLAFERLLVTRDLLAGHRALRVGQFDPAAPVLLAAIERMRRTGWGWLARSEHQTIAKFCQECFARRRFVGPAREIRDGLVSQFRPSVVARPVGYTSAEFGLLLRLAEPRGNKLLAREMGVTEATVKFHLRNIYRKMGVHRRSDAVTKARDAGWIITDHARL
jgi:DNA-binding CsgD family transcriptional regulator